LGGRAPGGRRAARPLGQHSVQGFVKCSRGGSDGLAYCSVLEARCALWATLRARVSSSCSQHTHGVRVARNAACHHRHLKSLAVRGRQRHRGPLAVVAEAPGGAARLARAVPALDGFPVVEVPAHSADAAYPHLGWQPRAARVAVQRVAAHGPWLRARPLARPTAVP